MGKVVFHAVPGLDGGAQHTRIGAQWQHIVVARHAAGQRDKCPRTVALGEGLATPARLRPGGRE
jgi:hypothetical protein